ncbi:primosomal protein N' family DNA-binding protein [Flaviflexus massiliensis]|uniref:primosomal protein N' family DNA-binding protein n=1 Tax=Flaviflexus massiliensis TaxID=1522309 RepID=UPI0006D557AA|nr:hypothetical protein [Flaviflexus massiliensis]
MPDALFDLPSQPALLKAERAVRTVEAEHSDPVAQVVLDTPFSWPDKLYDYLVPAKLHDSALPGSRVRVQFGAKRLTGFIRRRTNTTTSVRLKAILSVLGEPVVTDDMFVLAEKIAMRNVCSLHDVLRSAIPARHARAATSVAALPPPTFPTVPPLNEQESNSDLNPGADSGRETVIAAGRDVWTDLARASHEALTHDKTVLIVVPTTLEIGKVRTSLSELIPGEPIGIMGAHLSAEARYRHFLSILQGRTRIVIGTRTAAFAPMKPGLMIIVDEMNGAMRDKRSPYMWADEVLRMRQGDATLLRYSFPPRLSETPPQFTARGAWPKITRAEQWAGDQRGLLPPAAFEVIRDGLTTGPVLISAPRAGYVPALACARCGKRAICQHCGSSIAVPTAGSIASCGRCGAGKWVCSCGSTQMRAVSRGSDRLAQEVALAFPGVGVDAVRSASEESQSRLVIATPGAEPDREFAAGVIVDAGARLASLRLDAEIEAVARWSRVASRITGHLVLTGGVPEHLVRALATRSIDFMGPVADEREVLGQPPFHRWFRISGQRGDLQRLLGSVASMLEGDTPPDTGIAAMLSGGGRQVFAQGLHLVGPVEEDDGLALYLHERAPARRLASALRESLQDLGQLQIRIEADPIL